MRTNDQRYYFLWAIIGVLTVASLVGGCGSSEPTTCDRTTDPASGNLGGLVNSAQDDFAPIIDLDGTLLFTSNRKVSGAKFINR
jgi:hypothetical protein